MDDAKSTFLNDLESDFNKYQPYHLANSLKSQEFVSLNSWHESTRALNGAQPELPSSRVGFPAVPTHAHSSSSRPNTQTQGLFVNSSRPHTQCGHNISGNNNNSGPPRSQSQANSHHNGDDNFVKVDMVSMCSQGWNLSHVSILWASVIVIYGS
jgi:hypothetical protein